MKSKRNTLMPKFYIKKGLATPELKQYIEDNKDEPFIRVDIEVESTHERLRRSFHGLLLDVVKSGEHNIEVEGNRIVTFYDLKNYYKILGCDGIPEYYRFKKYTTKDGDKLRSMIIERFGHDYLEFIVEEAKSWNGMSKKAKSKALNFLLTDINYKSYLTRSQRILGSDTNNFLLISSLTESEIRL